MSKRMMLLTVGAMLLPMAIAGCRRVDETGLPNPASVYCEEQGGTVDLREGEEGVVGYCMFDDGSECEEWAYFRGECSPGESLEAIGLPNPASAYCEEQGGTIEMRENEAGVAGFCIFEDGSECDEWAYFRGECQPGQ